VLVEMVLAFVGYAKLKKIQNENQPKTNEG
jgi:hypothetical protein